MAPAPATAGGQIEALYLKHGRGAASVATAAVTCTAGLGIDGDVHANRLSPRQVLVTLDSELVDLRIAPGALGENIVMSCDRADLFRPGSAIVGASGVEIRLTMFCEPCQRIAHLEPRLSRLLHRRGVLGVFETGGVLRSGDALQLIGDRYSPLPESPYQKFLDFVATIPAGRVVRYIDVTIAIGAADSFVRALPGYIRRGAGTGLPFHRIVTARGALLHFIPDQARQLREEGVIAGTSVDLARYQWQGGVSSGIVSRALP
jgi:alkylated DNA nucleotide flippase Atl1